MSRVHLLTRYIRAKNSFLGVHNNVLHKAQLSSSSSDDEKHSQKKSDAKKKSEDALNKLNQLLKTMIEEDVTTSNAKLDLARPLNKRRKDAKQEEAKPEKPKSPELQITTAVKDVAESLGGDTKQTESELLMKLLGATNGEKASATSLIELMKGMKVDNENAAVKGQSKAEQVRQILKGKTGDQSRDAGKSRPRINRIPKTQLVTDKIDLFGSEPLGIFTEQSDANEGVENKIWNKLYERDLKLTITHPPRNYFEQMILWTEQGKVWKFPIDNEQGLEEERKVYFTEHVFLDKHLEPWCPPKGPMRHFMELVCVGLSKNPYLTVEAKKEHIEWFRNYFDEKKQLLKEVGLIQDLDAGDRKSSPKQIE